MVLPLLLVLAQAAPPDATPQRDIVVIARRSEKELAACLARNCPPAQEIEASLQASVEQFSDGRYNDVRQTLRRAISRNREHAATMPGEVSSLYATLATVAEHEGDTGLWLQSARNNVLVLRKHVGPSAAATLEQELAFADDLIGLGQPDSARDIYAKVERLGSEAGRNSMAAAAAFRRAWLALIEGRYAQSRSLADRAVALSGSDSKVMSELREILHMRIALKRGDEGAVDVLAARLRQSADLKPTILSSPPIDDVNVYSMGPQTAGSRTDSGIRYADVGFWVRPGGRTADVEVLRTTGLGQWEPVVSKQVRGRRYVPLALQAGSPGLYRIDRFTVRAAIEVQTGSRIRQRGGRQTVHIVDLTETDAMSKITRERTAATQIPNRS